MIKRDKLGRFVSTKRIQKNKRAVAVKAAKTTKRTIKTQKKAKKA